MSPQAEKNKRRKSPEASEPEMAGIRTIHIATKILDALAEYREPVRVTDLARKLGMTMPTVSRHLTTWRDLGYVDKPEGQETYRLGMKLFSLGNAAAEQNSFVNVAYPFLLSLRDKLHETTLFVARMQGQPTVLACLDSGRPTTVVARPGTSPSLPYSPTARVMWAFQANALKELDDVAEHFDYSEVKGWSAAVFKQRVRAALDNWYDYEADVHGDGIASACAPVFGHDGKIVATVTIIWSSTGKRRRPSSQVINSVQQCAAAISEALGAKNWKTSGIAALAE